MENDPVAQSLRVVGIEPAFRTFSEGTDTAEQAAAAIGCELGAIVKSLLFMTTAANGGEENESKGELLLALVSGVDRLDENRLAAELGEGRQVRKATAREVEERTGFKIGTVPPMGHRVSLPVFLDRVLMDYRVLWAASGVRQRVFPISPVMLAAVSGANIADIRQTDKQLREKQPPMNADK
jgi:prolyl-tRNA editing enzyme YbaK/EbsC (Cys-tRNA(Pro) deacylase)